MSTAKVIQPVSVCVGTTGSYRHGFRRDNSEKHPWKRLISKNAMAVPKEASVDTVVTSIRSELESISSLTEEH